MRAKRRPWFVLLSAGLVWVISAGSAGAEDQDGEKTPPEKEPTEKTPGAPSVGTCVSVESAAQKDGIQYTLENDCSTNLSCTVRWELRCGSPETPGTEQTKTLFLGSERFGTIKASAATCDGDWAVTNPRWDCSPTQ